MIHVLMLYLYCTFYILNIFMIIIIMGITNSFNYNMIYYNYNNILIKIKKNNSVIIIYL